MSIERKWALICAGAVLAGIIAGLIIYISWLRAEPAFSESRELTVIIDPGHGGEDGGAVSVMGAYESAINLDISIKLRDVLGLFGVKVIMTRDSETIDYPSDASTLKARKTADQKSRLSLINSTPNAVLISIHQNQYTSSKPFGAQVLYAPTDGSREFAELMQNNLITALNSGNYRTAAQIQDSIYIMNNISCPGVLVECGFLSNPAEEKLLRDDGYQTKLAAIIGSSFMASTYTFDNIYFGGANES